MTSPSVPSDKRTDRWKARVAATQQKVEASRDSKPAVAAAFSVYKRDRHMGGSMFASAVAYKLFLWSLPFALLIAGVLGLIHSWKSEEPSDLADALGFGSYVTSSVADAAEQSSSSWWFVLIAAILGLAWASWSGARTFRAIYSIAWGLPVERDRRPWLSALAFMGFAFAIAAMAVLSNWFHDRSVVLGIGGRILMIVLLIVWAFALCWALPHRCRWTQLVPGALLLGVSAQILHLFTAFYLGHEISSSSELYGGLGTAATILFWLYCIGRLIVGAAVLNATLCERNIDVMDAVKVPFSSG